MFSHSAAPQAAQPLYEWWSKITFNNNEHDIN